MIFFLNFSLLSFRKEVPISFVRYVSIKLILCITASYSFLRNVMSQFMLFFLDFPIKHSIDIMCKIFLPQKLKVSFYVFYGPIYSLIKDVSVLFLESKTLKISKHLYLNLIFKGIFLNTPLEF